MKFGFRSLFIGTYVNKLIYWYIVAVHTLVFIANLVITSRNIVLNFSTATKLAIKPLYTARLNAVTR